MIDLLLFLTALLSFIVIGYPFSYFFLIREKGEAFHAYAYIAYLKEYGRIFVIVISFFIGTLFASLYLTVLSFFGPGYDWIWVASFTGAFLIADIIIFVLARKRFRKSSRSALYSIDDAKFLLFEKKEKSNEKKSLKERLKAFWAGSRCQHFFAALLIALIVFNVATSLFFAVLYPIRFWDAVSSYSLKSKAFYIDGSIMPFYSDYGYRFSFLSYPLYFSLTQTWVMIWMRNINENVLKILFPVFGSGLLYSLYFLFAKKMHRLLALLLVFVFSSLPIVIDHGYIEYPNLLFGTLLLLGAVFFYRSIQKENMRCFRYVSGMRQKTSGEVFMLYNRIPAHAGSAAMLLSAVFFSMLALLRVEGLFYLGLFLLLNMIFHVINGAKTYRANRSAAYRQLGPIIKKTLFHALIPMVMSFLIYLPWLLVMVRFRLSFWGPDWDRASSQGRALDLGSFWEAVKAFGAQFLFSNFDSTRAFLGSSYGVLWIVLAVLFLVHLKKMFRESRYLYLLFILFNFISIIAASVHIKEFIGSLERYMLASLPLATYYVLSNSFRKRKETKTKMELPQENPNQSRRF